MIPASGTEVFICCDGFGLLLHGGGTFLQEFHQNIFNGTGSCVLPQSHVICWFPGTKLTDNLCCYFYNLQRNGHLTSACGYTDLFIAVFLCQTAYCHENNRNVSTYRDVSLQFLPTSVALGGFMCHVSNSTIARWVLSRLLVLTWLNSNQGTDG